jgi:hypothetical protein
MVFCGLTVIRAQRWRRQPRGRGLARVGHIGKDMTVLRLERGHPGQHRFDNARPVGPLGPQAAFAPPDPWTDRARSGLVGRLHACDPHQRPQRIVHLEHLATYARGCGHAAGLTGLEPSCDRAPPRPPQDLELGVWQRSLADTLPRLNHLSALSPPGRPKRLRRPATRKHRLNIPPQMCPTPRPPSCRIPQVGTPAVRDQDAAAPVPQQLLRPRGAPRQPDHKDRHPRGDGYPHRGHARGATPSRREARSTAPGRAAGCRPLGPPRPAP